MKPKRVDCCNCQRFQVEGEPKKFKYSCELGKRVMFRAPVGYWYFNSDFLFPRYCDKFEQIETI